MRMLTSRSWPSMNNGESNPESEEEFYEDFSGWEITEKELNEILADARKSGDVRIRRLVKQVKYLKFLMPRLIELAEHTDRENTFVALSKAALKLADKDKQS